MANGLLKNTDLKEIPRINHLSPHQTRIIIMLNIIVSGAAERTGTRITALANDHKDLKVVGVHEHKYNHKIGADIGYITGTGKTGITIADDINSIKKSRRNKL